MVHSCRPGPVSLNPFLPCDFYNQNEVGLFHFIQTTSPQLYFYFYFFARDEASIGFGTREDRIASRVASQPIEFVDLP